MTQSLDGKDQELFESLKREGRRVQRRRRIWRRMASVACGMLLVGLGNVLPRLNPSETHSVAPAASPSKVVDEPAQLEQRASQAADARSRSALLTRAARAYLDEGTDVEAAWRCYRDLAAEDPEGSRAIAATDASFLLLALTHMSKP
ncbi:MAG: hypothetical protein KDB53_10965 [Planctomycetes bacterium]|nr:hypothetical protein [Planctomycetota bacterium]